LTWFSSRAGSTGGGVVVVGLTNGCTIIARPAATTTPMTASVTSSVAIFFSSLSLALVAAHHDGMHGPALQ
jgi:hypothetical protein